MDPIVIKLGIPIKFGTETISELKMRPGKAKDFRDLPIEPKLGDYLNVAAKLCGQPPSVIDELDPTDLAEVMSAVGKLMGNGRAPGAPTSGL
jgi:hypothetical protein